MKTKYIAPLAALLVAGCSSKRPAQTPPPVIAPVVKAPEKTEPVTLAPVQARVAPIMEKNKELVVEVERQKGIGNLLRDALSQAQEAVEVTKAQWAKITEHAQALEASRKDLEAIAQAQQGSIIDLTAQVQESDKKVALAQQELRESREALEVANTRIEETTEQSRSYGAERDSMARQLDTVTGNITEMEKSKRSYFRWMIGSIITTVLVIVGAGYVLFSVKSGPASLVSKFLPR